MHHAYLPQSGRAEAKSVLIMLRALEIHQLFKLRRIECGGTRSESTTKILQVAMLE
jgi:hypothetical protein